jgi:ferredoxin
MKVIHNKSKCIGCGSCVAVCPDFFELAEEGKAHLKKSEFDEKNQEESLEVEKKGCFQDAADVCPVQCIKFEDKKEENND